MKQIGISVAAILLLFLGLTMQPVDAPVVRVYENTGATVTYPILVMADENATAITQASFTLDTASPDRIYLRVNNLRYNNKGRVRLNNGTAKTWVQFNETNATCGSYESYGCMAINAHSIVRFTLDVPSDWLTGGNPLQVGVNTFDFEMTVPGASKVFVDNGHGYRILWFDVLESGDGYTGTSGVTQYWKDHGGDVAPSKTGSALHVTDTIVFEDYSSTAWRSADISSHFENASSESDGLTLFNSATITDNLGNATSATCADCHDKAGHDLSYFRIENAVIIEVAEARGLTNTEGQKIAAYIRSLDDTFTLSNGSTPADPPGYPWCGWYQPGDSYVTGDPLSESDTFYWPAGSCEILDYDSEASPEFLREVAAWDVTTVADDFNYEDVPIATSMPGYHQWLPISHMMDFASGGWSNIEDDYDEYVAASGASQINTEGHQFNIAVDQNRKVGQGSASSQLWGVWRTDVIRLANMKHLERQFFTDGDYHAAISDVYGTSAGVPSGARGWIHRQSRSVFHVAPHISSPTNASGGYEFSEIGDVRGQVYANHNWYQLSRYLTPGWDQLASAQVPVDNQYQVAFMYDKSSAPYKFLGTIIDQLDMLWKVNGSGNPSSNSTELTRARGWTPNTMNVFFYGQQMYDEGGVANISASHHATWINAVLQAYYDVITRYAPSYTSSAIARGTQRYEFDAIGTNPTGSISSPFGTGPQEWDNANNFYRFIIRSNAVPGVNKSLLLDVAEMFEDFYGSTTVDWGAVVDADPGGGTVSVSVPYPSGGESFVQGDIVAGTVTIVGADSMAVFLQKGGVTVSTADSVEASSNFTWALDSTLTVDTDYRFGVSTSKSGGATAYSGVFSVTEYTAPTAEDSVDVGALGALTQKDWSDGSSNDLMEVTPPDNLFRATQGTPFALSSQDYGPALWRDMHAFEAYQLKLDSLTGPLANSYLLFELRDDTVATSAAFGMVIYPMGSDSFRVRASARRTASASRIFLPDTSGAYNTLRVSRDNHLIVSHDGEGVASIWRDADGLTGGEVKLAEYDMGGSYDPPYMSLSLNPRSGVSGSGMRLVVEGGNTMIRRSRPDATQSGPILTPGEWQNVTAGADRLAIIVIPTQFYPNSSGVTFSFNDDNGGYVVIDTDTTGPQEPGSGQYNMYPTQTFTVGDKIKAEWTDQSGTDRYDEYTVIG